MMGARRWDTMLDIGSAPRKQGKFPANAAENRNFTVLDLTLARIVNGADCWPHSRRGGHDGAIAQLGERVVRNDEVGGSIPPGSTTLRPSGYAWRSRAMPEERSVPGVAHLGEDGLPRAQATLTSP